MLKNYKSTILFLIILLLTIIVVFIFTFDFNVSGSLPPPVTPISNTFYIGWYGGAIARSCPELECKQNYSFSEGDPIELPYSSIEDIKEWVDLSHMCGKKCFVNKSVFSLTPNTVLATSIWEDKIARITCTLDDGSLSSGSGLLTKSDGQIAIVTAKHIIEHPENCEVHLPKQGFKKVSKESFSLHDNYDIGFILLVDYNEEVNKLAKEPISICKSPAIAESIFIFGYPDIARSKNVTVTSGIISTIEEYYYLTNADAGHGNSGGVAVKEESGCYLGIPIQVSKGELENLTVVLKATILNYDKTNGFSF